MSKNFVFTLNNPHSLLDLSPHPEIEYCVYSEEVGNQGTPHFQGYIELKSKQRLSFFKNVKGLRHAWIQLRRGTQTEARAYAMKKDETHIDGPYEYGTFTPKRQGSRTDLLDMQAELKRNLGLRLLVKNSLSNSCAIVNP